MQPIAAFNAGAKAIGRLKQTIKSSLVYEIVTVAILTVIIWIAAYPICAFFNPEVAELAAGATRISIIACCLGYTSMMMSTYFQTVEKIALSTVLGLSRYVVFSCPLMAPKVRAALRFCENRPNRTAIIGSLDNAPEVVRGISGTRIHY